MDISKIKPQTQTVEITHPATKQPIGIRVVLRSLQDEELKAMRRSQEDKAFARESKNKAIKADQFHEDLNQTIFRSIVSWEFYKAKGEKTSASWKGNEKPDLNRKTVHEMLEELEWFKEQLSEVLSETEGFFTN